VTVLDIGDVALDLVGIPIKARQLPGQLSCLITGLQQSIHECLVAAHQPRSHVSQSYDTPTGKRRQVYDSTGLTPRSIPERICQDEAPLSIGTDDLDG